MKNDKFEAIIENANRVFWDAIKPHPIKVGGRVFVLYKPVQPERDALHKRLSCIPKEYIQKRLEEILYESDDSS